MDAYLYQAAFLCGDCGRKRIAEIEATRPLPEGYPSDSDAYPQGSYSDGGGEADSPQHCDHCNVFLENPLTSDGYDYVAEQMDNYGSNARGSHRVLQLWARFYGGDHDELDRAIEESGILLPHSVVRPESILKGGPLT